jgi:hypothetical protein
MSEHERFEDTAGAFVLGALPDDERAAYAAHLATCTVCQAEVEELSLAADALPMAAPAMKPPPALKARIMAEVEREAALLASASEPRTEAREPKRRRWRFNLPLGAVAALACTALLFGIGAGALLFGGGGTSVPFKVDPSLQQASAELEIDGDKAIIVANKLPAPDGYYMVWLVGEDGKPKPTSALFTPRGDGSATASVTGVGDAKAVLVNTERSPDVNAPTSPVLMEASLT